MEKAILDLTDCKYLLEMHERIKNALAFPDYYGQNWSAFWDCLVYDSPVEYLEVRGEETVPDKLKPSLEKMHQILHDAKARRKELGWKFDYEIIRE